MSLDGGENVEGLDGSLEDEEFVGAVFLDAASLLDLVFVEVESSEAESLEAESLGAEPRVKEFVAMELQEAESFENAEFIAEEPLHSETSD